LNKYYNNFNYKDYLIIFFFFILVRFIIFFYFEIGPIPSISHFWQYINEYYLYKDLFNSLIYLHFQPFGFNLLLGLFLKIANGKIQTMVNLILILNIFLTFLIIIYSIKILEQFYIKKRFTYLIIIFFIVLNPTFVFWENYIMYAHLTCFLYFQIFYFLLKFYKNYSIKYEIFIYLSLLTLTFIHSLYHPLIIVLFFITFQFLNKFTRNVKSYLIFFLFLCISITPLLKNKIIFGIFANGSSLGVNWFITIHSMDLHRDKCLFVVSKEDNTNYFKEFEKDPKYFTHPVLNGNGPISQLNNPGMIYKSKLCFKETIKEIKNNFFLWFKKRIYYFLMSHGKFSIDYSYNSVINWKKNFSFLEIIQNNIYAKAIRQFVLISFVFSMYLFFIKKIFFSKENLINRKVFFTIFSLYSYMLFMGHFFNSWEQERFMYAGMVLYLIYIRYLLKYFFKI
jgi:hypothetical protein